ncbi:MAG: iron-sulfur cluster assembly scaffold protein [Desulfarculus sp.]|nr:MAG: iron-sulfur cluster assembly scaffold protein [Desulfarculus sp.]
MLSELIKDHIRNPRNEGFLPAADGAGELVGPVCGDQVTFYLKVREGRITAASFTTPGCWALIAVCSYLTELVQGKTLEEALAVDGLRLAQEEAGLPEDKWPCAGLAAAALHQAARHCRRGG